MKNLIDEWDTWYISRNFPRGIVGNDDWYYVRRYYRRIYDRLKQWNDLYSLYADLFLQYFDAADVEAFLVDPVDGWGTKTWGAQNGFNYLVKIVLMPDVTSYVQLPYLDGTDLGTTGYVGGTELGISQARYYSTSWHDGTRECGYTWWECMYVIGSYLDKIMAIYALSDSQTNFVARSSPEDIRQWEVSYYSTFPEQINKISSAMMSRDYRYVGPYTVGEQLVFPNYAGDLSTDNSGSLVDPFATFTIQLYWQVLGQARFFNDYNQAFRDEARLFVLGTSNSPDINHIYTFRDPLTGLVYGALEVSTINGTGELGSGEAILKRANMILARSSYCDDGTIGTTTADDDCTTADAESLYYYDPDYEIVNQLDMIKVMADIYPMMDYGDPYNP
jgi:hypothetical protein